MVPRRTPLHLYSVGYIETNKIISGYAFVEKKIVVKNI